MLEAIITYLNLKLGLLNYFEQQHCLCELKSDNEGKVSPVEYVGDANYTVVSHDAFDGVSYWRLRDKPTQDVLETKYQAGKRVEVKIPLRLVFSVRRDKLTTDDAYAFDRIRQTVVAQFNFDDGILKTTLGADKVMVSVPTSNGDAKEVWDEETSETGTFEPTYAMVYGSIDIEVSVIYAGSCLPTECDDIDPNILHAFDFCKPSVVAQLTPAQLTCLETEICTPCADVTQQVNGTTIGTTASGGTNNQLIRNTAGTAVGTSANPSIVANTTLRNSAAPTWTDSVVSGVTKTLAQGKALDSDGATTLLANYIPTTDGFMFTCTPAADATVTINGASLGATGDIPSGGSEDLDVLQGGVAAGSWNGSAWIIPTCPSVPSLAVSVASGTPTYNGTVLITATASNITPTSYTFILPDEERGFDIVTQVGNTYLWTVTGVGTDTIRVTATDGASTVGGTASVTVTDPLDYLTRINHWRGDTGVTLVSGLVDSLADQGTSGDTLTAQLSTHRTFYNSQLGYLSAENTLYLNKSTGNPYNGKTQLTGFFITQKTASVASNLRFAEFGAGAMLTIGVSSVVGGDLMIGYNNFSQYVSATTGVGNGRVIIFTYDGTLGSNRTVLYSGGVALAPASTVGNGGPASIGSGAGVRLFNSFAGSSYNGSMHTLGMMDGLLTPTQIAALSARLTQIHIR